MIAEITFDENQNGFGGSFWKTTIKIGKDSMHDVKIHELLGYNNKNQDGVWELHEHHESYDEEKDEVIESSVILHTAKTEQECIDFGKEYFGVKESL